MGYGNAAGYLYGRGVIQPPPNQNDLPIDELFNIGEDIDFVTGCFKQKKVDPKEGMTEEEIDRETEKLFHLFDRLNKNGMVKTIRKDEK